MSQNDRTTTATPAQEPYEPPVAQDVDLGFGGVEGASLVSQPPA